MVTAIMPLSATVFAQKGAWDVGAKGGVDFSRMCCASMTINEDYTYNIGPTFGLTGSYGLTKNLSLVAELNYTTQGGKRNGMQAITAGTTTRYADFDNKTILNYLELPVMARYTMGDQFKYYVNAGPYIGYLLTATQKASGTSKLYTDKDGNVSESSTVYDFKTDADVKSDFKDINFGLQGGIGAGYTFGKHGIWVDGRYIWGIPNIRENTAVNGENSTGSIGATIGYTYRIK